VEQNEIWHFFILSLCQGHLPHLLPVSQGEGGQLKLQRRRRPIWVVQRGALVSEVLEQSERCFLGLCGRTAHWGLWGLYHWGEGQQQHPNCVLLQHRPVQHSSIISSTDRSYSRQLAASTFLVKSRICGGSRRNENSIYFNKIDDARCSW